MASVGVVLPTIPGRAKHARRLVEVLRKQRVDRFCIQFNGYERLPKWAVAPDIVAVRNKAGTGPLARYRKIPKTEFILSIDDDLVLPAGYVKVCVENLREYGRGHALSFHVSGWKEGAEPQYQNRHTLMYSASVDRPKRACYAGSGVSSFWREDLQGFAFEEAPPIFEMEDDVWISAAAARSGVQFIRPPTCAKWIDVTPQAGRGLYRQARGNQFKKRNRAIEKALALGGWVLGPVQDL